MAVLSCIIPSYKDPLLNKTVTSLLENAVGDVEVLPVLDGYVEELPKDPRLKPILLDTNKGMRGAFNSGLAVATGDYIMKSDSHCCYAPGYDKALVEVCEDDWLVIPRRYSLLENTWTRNETRPMYDYHFFSFPYEGNYGYDMAVLTDRNRTNAKLDIPLDDTMVFQGSCYVANKKYFMEHLGFLDDRNETYGSFACEPAEVGLKYWLGGGRVVTNKNTWYAHLHKNKAHYFNGVYGVNYKRGRIAKSGHTYATHHWLRNEEPNMIHDFKWLLEKFWPVPTWSENWEELYSSHKPL